MTAGAAALVLDEHLTGPQVGLQQRGYTVYTVDDFDLKSTLDPDVIRGIAASIDTPWVLVTLDGSIVDDSPGFEWERYAIAWVVVDEHLRGAAVEEAKIDIVQHHARRIVEQRAGDHFTYTADKRFKHPPSLMSRERRSS